MTKVNIFDLDITKLKPSSWFHISFLNYYDFFVDFVDELTSFPSNLDLENRLQEFIVTVWLDTDTEAGIKLYTLDYEPIFYTYLSGRKSDIIVKFKDVDSIHKLEKYLRTLRPLRKINNDLICDDNDKYIDEFYNVGNAYNLVNGNYHERGFYNNREVTIVKEKLYLIGEKVKVKFIDDSTTKIVKASEVNFPIMSHNK